MNSKSTQSTSLWRKDIQPQAYTPLTSDMEADICIIGAGIAGMMAAYYLSQAGKQVVVIDDGAIGSGETGNTSAHLSSALDDRFYALEELFGTDGARLAAESHAAAIDAIERIVRSESIDCGFERVEGFLFPAEERPAGELDRELDAARRAGFTEARILGRIPGYPFETGPCLYFPNQARFHPLRFLAALAQIVVNRGGRVYTGTHADAVADGDRPTVATPNGTITAGDIVVATNTPINDRFAIHTKQAPYRTYVIGARVPRGSVPDLLAWDTGDPYHYVRIDPTADSEYDILIVGGEDHKTGHDEQPEDSWQALEEWTRERFPMLRDIPHRWSGQVLEPIDSLAFIGRNPGDEHIYIATGDSGHGLTHGAIAGMLITDLITGRSNPWADLYDPSRITVTLDTAKEFVREGLHVAAHYTSYLTPGDVASEDEIAPGCGAVLRSGAGKTAVYRDTNGSVHRLSAVCPHMGCIVDWNDAEKSWDCPCHGSRFDPHGQVLNGPANTDLEPVDTPADR